MVPEDKADEAKVRYSVLKPEIGDLHKQNGGKWGERGVEPEAIAKKLAQTIVKLAERTKTEPQRLLESISTYHMCDAGSYKSMVIYYPPEPLSRETKSVETRPNATMQRGIDQTKKAIGELTKAHNQQTSDASQLA